MICETLCFVPRELVALIIEYLCFYERLEVGVEVPREKLEACVKGPSSIRLKGRLDPSQYDRLAAELVLNHQVKHGRIPSILRLPAGLVRLFIVHAEAETQFFDAICLKFFSTQSRDYVRDKVLRSPDLSFGTRRSGMSLVRWAVQHNDFHAFQAVYDRLRPSPFGHEPAVDRLKLQTFAFQIVQANWPKSRECWSYVIRDCDLHLCKLFLHHLIYEDMTEAAVLAITRLGPQPFPLYKCNEFTIDPLRFALITRSLPWVPVLVERNLFSRDQDYRVLCSDAIPQHVRELISGIPPNTVIPTKSVATVKRNRASPLSVQECSASSAPPGYER